MEPFLAMARTPQSRSWSLSSNLLAGALGQSTADEIAAAVDSMDPTPAQSPRLGAAFAWPSSVPGTAGARVAPLAIGHPTAGDSPGRAQARGGAQTVGGRGSPLAVGSGWPHAGALGSSILSQLAAEGRIPGPSRAAQQLGPGNHGRVLASRGPAMLWLRARSAPWVGNKSTGETGDRPHPSPPSLAAPTALQLRSLVSWIRTRGALNPVSARK